MFQKLLTSRIFTPFIEVLKFSIFHNFNSGEIIALVASQRNLLIPMTVNPFSYVRENALEALSNKYSMGFVQQQEQNISRTKSIPLRTK